MWASAKKENSAIKDAKTFNFRCRTLTPLLGTYPTNEDLYRDYIASQAPDAKTIEQELADVEGGKKVEEIVKQGTTVFPTALFFKYEKDGTTQYSDMQLNGIPAGMTEDDGEIVRLPYIADYQWKGGFKEALAMMNRAGTGTAASKIKAAKKVVDGNWFVFPRRIPMIIPDTYEDEFGITQSTWIDAAGNPCAPDHPEAHLRTLSRPLRTSGPSGERTAISSSEIIPIGTEFAFQVMLLNPKHAKALMECMDYKMLHGMLQWRNSGMGRVDWTLADELGRPVDTDMAQLVGSDDDDADDAVSSSPKKRGRKPAALKA